MSKSTGQQYVIDELTKLAGLLQSGNSSIANADKVFKDVQTAKPEDRLALTYDILNTAKSLAEYSSKT
ncbi:MAG: hypothetical protein KKE30_12850 [Gammaproteobacteria bacterium]|nr:hypothetical protein [Gammaproteobacteria bacterium]MBU1555610.1 hypothetical protein [Gammaproteobacteria bacterium]MBU2069908.1 hypothetical protein [Gammaproteobacteria bacterium]MBU2184810.1 hypothetical protein [Gammaproteobacteria bacterium]MBU2204346.1 hypothetical protein [Gammaproteobacteria bacterium]